MEPDVELLSRWRAGDNAAGRELVDRHFGVIHRFFRSKVDADADDLTQRTFEACLQAAGRVDAIQSFRGYALGVARHVLFDHFRATKRAKRIEDFMERSVEDLGGAPSQVAARREEHKLLLIGLRALPLDLQITLELFYWEGMTQLEIAGVVGIPEGTAKSRLNRARRMLKARIEQAARSPAILQSTLGGFETWTRSLRELLDAKP